MEDIAPQDYSKVFKYVPENTIETIWHYGVEQPFIITRLHDKPILRFIIISVIAGAAIYYFKPSAQFDEKGKARPFVVTSPKVEGATPFPWWLPAISIGLLSVVFV